MYVLERIVRDLPLDFVVLSSTASTILGGLSFSADSGCGWFMEMFAVKQSQQCKTPWLSVSWDGWVFHMQPHETTEITPAEGPDVVQRVFLGGFGPRVIVSKTSLQPRLDKWSNRVWLRKDKEDSRAPLHSRPELNSEYVAPTTPVEKRLAEIWANALGLEQLGVYDNFFELGGHSLLGTQIASKIRVEFQVDLSLRKMLEAPTIAGQAAAIVALRGETNDVTAAPFFQSAPEARFEPFALNDTQSAMWLGRSGYFDAGAVGGMSASQFELPAALIPQFEAAWNKIQERHDAFRTTFLTDAQQVVQRHAGGCPIPVEDLSSLSPSEMKKAVEDTRRRLLLSQPDVSKLPLCRFLAQRVSDEQVVVHFAQPHLLTDGHSYYQVMWSDFTRYLAGVEPDKLEITFRDCVLTQADQQGKGTEETDYWHERLPSLPWGPILPLSRPLTPNVEATPRWFAVEVGGERSERLKEMASSHAVSLSATMLGCYMEVLRLWSESSDFLIGVAQGERPNLHPKVGDIVGTFSSLLLVSPGSASESLETNIARAQRQMVSQSGFRGWSALRELGRLRGGTSTTAVPVGFNSVVGKPGMGTSTEAAVSTIQGHTIWDVTTQALLMLTVIEDRNGLVCIFDGRPELWLPDTIESLAQAMMELLDRLATDSAAWSAASSDLTADLAALQRLPTSCEISDMHRLPEYLQRYACPFPAPTPINTENMSAPPVRVATQLSAPHRLDGSFVHMATTRGNEIAVVTPGGSTTYDELQRRATAIGHGLAELGVGPGQLVGIDLGGGWEDLAVALAILGQGAGFVMAPPAGGEPVCRSLDLGLVISANRDAHPWHDGVSVIAVDALTVTPQVEKPGEPEPTWPAVGILAAPSTPEEKVALFGHDAAGRAVARLCGLMELRPGERALLLAPLSQGLGLFAALGSLSVGATLVMPDAANPYTVSSQWLASREVSICIGSSELMKCMNLEGGGLPSLKRLVTSDDRPIEHNAERIVIGGPWEAGIWSVGTASDDDPHGVSRVWPISDEPICVWDDDDRPRPVWVVGEARMSGETLAYGYVNDPQTTAAAFRPHPRGGSRLLHSGLLSRRMPSGEAQLLGRLDADRINLHGHRVLLREVEAFLNNAEGVEEAVVFRSQDALGRWRPVACVLAKTDADLSPEALQHRVSMEMSEYCAPMAIFVADALPTTPHGELDRARVTELFSLPVTLPADVSSPQPTEHVLMTMWKELLNIDEIGVGDNFFALGGDSLLATLLLDRISERYGHTVSMAALVLGGSVRALASHLK